MSRRRRPLEDAGGSTSDASEHDTESASRVNRSASLGSVGSVNSEADSDSSNSIGNTTSRTNASKVSSSSNSTSSSRKGRRKPTGSFGSRGDMLDDGAISKSKQAQLDRELRTVDAVIRDMEELALTPEEGILYVMINSVDVQRIATLQQMNKHVDNEDPSTKPIRFRLLLHLLVNIHSYTPAVQVACAAGISDMIPSLETDIKHSIYMHTKRVMFNVDTTAFSAWCSLLFLSIKHLTPDTLSGDVFLFLESMTDPRMPEKERRFGCKLIAAIAETDRALAWRLLSTVQKLALDPLASVRRALADSLWAVLEALPRVSVREECIVNPLSKLLLDTNMDVSTATFKVMVQLLDVMDDAFVATFLFPVLLRYINNAPPSAQDVVYASFGKVVYYSRKSFTKHDYDTVLTTYTRMCRNNNEQSRKHCASNFLAMCATFNQQPTLLPKVLALLTSFVTDPSVHVRRSIAAGYHELFGLVLATVNSGGDVEGRKASVVGGNSGGSSVSELIGINSHAMMGLASTSYIPTTNVPGATNVQGFSVNSGVNGGSGSGVPPQQGGIFAFMATADHDETALSLVLQIKMVQNNALQLMDDTDLIVRERLFNHVGIYLRSFSEMYKGDVAERRRVLDTVIPPLIKFEQAITTNWRKLSQLLKYFDMFPRYFSFDRLERDLVPMLVGHLVNGAVALKRKIAVTIATFLRTCGTKEEAVRTSKAIHTLVRSLLHSSSSQHRIAYCILVEGMTSVFSSQFVGMYLYLPLCRLRDDAVPSVRSHLATVLPALLAIPSLKAKVEADLVSHLLKDTDAVVADKARRARTDASLLAITPPPAAVASPSGGNKSDVHGILSSSLASANEGGGPTPHFYVYDAARDRSLAQQEAILLTREVFKTGMEESQQANSGASTGAASNTSASGGAYGASVSPTHSPLAVDGDGGGRERDRGDRGTRDRGDRDRSRRRNSRSPSRR